MISPISAPITSDAGFECALAFSAAAGSTMSALSTFFAKTSCCCSVSCCAIRFAAHVVFFGFPPCTVPATSGVCPSFAMLPATAVTETFGRMPHSLRTFARTACELAIVRTVLGFVCALWSWMLPLAEYGWPRYSVAVALKTWLPPSESE